MVNLIPNKLEYKEKHLGGMMSKTKQPSAISLGVIKLSQFGVLNRNPRR